MSGWFSWLFRAVFALLVLAGSPVLAVQPDEILSNPALEARARDISRELRCMVCQNQSIDESDAPLAHDLRLLVRERLKAGDTDSQVLNYIVQRYGEFVLMRPSMSLRNALLWGLPVLMVLIGSIVCILALRQRGSVEAPALNADEETRVQGLISEAAAGPLSRQM